jgi:ABC-type lipoprotein export system ATPase subunit
MFRRWLKQESPPSSATNGRYRHGNDHLIELRQVIKTYQNAAGSFTALKGVDLRVDRGEFVAVIGKSGSGKSTLINMVTGIDRPSAGEVLVGDTAIHTLTEGQMAVWRGRNLGIIFQFFQLLPTLTVVENVMLPMDFCNMWTPRERHVRAMHLLEQVDLIDHANKLPSALSGGQQQRAAIARALANDPPILVADEPTGNLDSKTAESVFQLFEHLVQEGKTIMMVTHDTDLARRATRSVIVADGEIINQYVAQALSKLSMDQLAKVMRQVELRSYHPGETILTHGEQADTFYIVTKGAVLITLHHPDGQEIVVARLTSGEYFGEMGLLQGGSRMATVHADPDLGVEVALLDQDEFRNLLSESESTRQKFDRVMQQRLAAQAALRD